jgi:hypothetical protein
MLIGVLVFAGVIAGCARPDVVQLDHRGCTCLPDRFLYGCPRCLTYCLGCCREQSDPYVFFELLHAHETPRAEPDGWSVSTYRSRVSPGKNPTWGTPDDQFAFRFAVPTHEQHVAGRVRRESSSGSHRFSVTSAESTSTTAAAELWAAQVPEDCDEAVDALESLLPPLFRGPPTVLHCTVFHKNKVLAHQLMGRGEVRLLVWSYRVVGHASD